MLFKKRMRKILLLLVVCGLFSAMDAQMSKTETKQFLWMLQAAPTFTDVID